MSFPSYICVCVFSRIYIFVSTHFKPTKSYVANLFIDHGWKGGLIVFLLCFLYLSNNLVEADWGLSLKDELKFKKRLINLKKYAIKSIQTRDGDIYDCMISTNNLALIILLEKILHLR
ncbi:hypothetical protein SLA2020_527470 [Shorea laevis]